MEAEKRILVIVFAAFFLVSVTSAATTFGESGAEPVPNITSLEIYNVTGLNQQGRRNSGTLVQEGLNQTFNIRFSEYGVYRFEFQVENNGTGNWSLNSEDVLKHSGLDSSWNVKEIFYNISEAKFGGNFTSGTVNWDTSLGGKLEESGENSTMEAAYIVNMSTYSRIYDQEFKVNDTSNNAGSRDRHELKTVNLGYLNVSLIRPPNNTVLQRNKTFNVTGEVKCIGGTCGKVEVSTRYNASGTFAETLIPQGSGTPFYTTETNRETCSINLQRGRECRANISVNATGSVGSDYAIDVNASSNYSAVQENDTVDNNVVIKSTVIMSLSWSTLEFGVLSSGTENVPAEGNSALQYNITFSEDSVYVDSLFARATNLTSEKDPSYAIRPGNITLGFDQDPGGGLPLGYSFKEIKSGISPGTVVQTFFYLDVPYGMTEGGYNGTMIFKANTTS